MWSLSFISEEDFLKHVEATIRHYGDKLKPYDLKKFNKNSNVEIWVILNGFVYAGVW